MLLLVCTAPVARAAALQETFNAHVKHGAGSLDHSAWGTLLASHLRAGDDGLNRFDYAKLKKTGLTRLRGYIQRLQAIDPSTLTTAEQFAFWTNLYNAKTVEIVAERYPVSSIRDINLGGLPFSGPWKAKVVMVSGEALSLDDIEHRILRPVWKDPRIHYAVNCASVGCPNLAQKPYTGAMLEKMLDHAARAYINSPRGVRIEGSRVTVSSLFDWYALDFGRSAAEILVHIGKYAAPDLADKLKGTTVIDDYGYDWMLNDLK